MSICVGINGFGRIGRLVFKLMEKNSDIKIAAINDLTDPKTLAHLLKYDSVHGKFDGTVESDENNIIVNGSPIQVLKIKEPAELPWTDLGVEYVIESTGVFRTKDKIEGHIKAGAKKVILTVPAKSEIDATIVLGVNNDDLKPEHKIVSNASCTTNCLAPVVKVLDQNFKIVKGLMTTIHAYTNDQKLLDLPHKDLRRARAAAMSMIPTTTGATKAVGKVYKPVSGKLDGMAMRVPTCDASIIDFVAEVEKSASVDAINAAMKEAAEGELKGILEYCTDPIVSVDVIGNPHSSVFDSLATMVIEGNLVKVLSWYDNEFGYSCRVVDLLMKISTM